MFVSAAAWQDIPDFKSAAKDVVQACSHLGNGYLGRIGDGLKDEGAAPDHAPNVIGARKRALSFYPGYSLYELQLDPKTSLETRYFDFCAVYALIGPNGADKGYIMTGESPVIHGINGLHDANRRPQDYPLTLTQDTVADYLRFFCTFVAGEAGPFMLPETPNDFVFTPGPKEKAAKHENPTVNVTPVHLETDTLPFELTASVWYSDVLFEAKFSVPGDGLVQMVEDRPVAELSFERWEFADNAPVLGRRRKPIKKAGRQYSNELKAWLEGKKPESPDLENLHIEGDVDLSGLTTGKLLIMRDIKIDGDLILERADFDSGIELADFEIKGRLYGNGLHCRDIKAPKLKVSGNAPKAAPKSAHHRDTASLQLRAHVNGDVDLSGLEIAGKVALAGLRCEGDLRLTEATVEYRQDQDGEPSGNTNGVEILGHHGSISLKRARIKGSVFLENGKIHGSFDAEYAQIQTSIEANFVIVGGGGNGKTGLGGDVSGAFSFNYAHVGGTVNLYGANIAHQLSASSATIGKSVFADRISVGRSSSRDLGNININQASVGAYVSFRGTTLASDISLSGTVVGGMVIFDSLPFSETDIYGSVDLSGAHCNSDITFSGVTIRESLRVITGTFGRLKVRPAFFPVGEYSNGSLTGVGRVRSEFGDVIFQNCRFQSMDWQFSIIHNHAEFLDVHIDSDFETFFKDEDDPLRGLTWNWQDDDRENFKLPPISDLGMTIGGSLKMRGVTVGGRLSLTNLNCENGFIDLHYVDVGQDFTIARRYTKVAQVADFSCKTRRLTFVGGTVEHDLRLDGLDIACKPDEKTKTGPKVIDLTATRIEHELLLWNSEDTSACGLPDGATIDLSAVQARRLTFPRDANARNRYEMDRCRIGLFDPGDAFHGVVDLNDAKVDGWKIADSKLLELLNRSEPFNPAIYAQAEEWLRQRGNNTWADKVYRNMKWREVKKFQRVLGAVNGVLTGFWTRGPLLLIVTMLLTLPFAGLIVSGDKNLAPSDPANVEQPTNFDKLIVLLDLHVPLVSLVTEPDFEPRDTGVLYHSQVSPLIIQDPKLDLATLESGFDVFYHWILTRAYELTSHMSPAMLALLLKIVNWIVWPMALVSIAATIERRFSR